MSMTYLACSKAKELAAKHQGLSRPYILEPTDILKRQAEQESNARSYPRRIPLVLERAHGIYVMDTRGQVFIDCLAGAGTLALGHNHPAILEAMHNVLDAGLPLHTLDISTPVKDAFVQQLFEILPSEFSQKWRIQFCGPTGSDAVEAALKLTKTATGRSGVACFHGAYHGMTMGALALTGNLTAKERIGSNVGGVNFLPFPNSYRCPFGIGGEKGIDIGLDFIKNVLADPESGIVKPAAMILEPVQGEGGVIPTPNRWLAGVREVTSAMKIPLIFDEIQCGIGRTGKMFALEHSGVVPDVLVLSKALGGGQPLSVIVYRDELDSWLPGAHAGTFRGNQLAMACGTTTLRIIKDELLDAHVAAVGNRLRNHIDEIAVAYPWLGDVRGCGLMIGIEIIDPNGPFDTQGNRLQDGVRAKLFQQECLKRGLILELGGRHSAVVRLLPPLIVSEQEVDLISEILAAAAESTNSQLMGIRSSKLA